MGTENVNVSGRRSDGSKTFLVGSSSPNSDDLRFERNIGSLA